jgi:TonB family protein
LTLTAGTRLGVYEIADQIGEGGMGQVYRATDTRLKRQVAIKILPPSLAADHHRLARFQREAEILASLNHPHIAGIYGLEESNGVSALVMELVDGDDLSWRIARGAIPIDEALPMAMQIAEALEAAHEQGIIHRDLKPANIKVRSDDTVKVLDFGLAKALDTAETADAEANSSTITSPVMTQAGMILGTAAYMSPEQARGRVVDRRADVWALGCVLYEMLTATRAFDGDTITDVLSSVVSKEPDWTRLPRETPMAVQRLLRRSLRKDVRTRLQSAGDARVELGDVLAANFTDGATSVAARRLHWLAAFGFTCIGAAVAYAALSFLQPSADVVADPLAMTPARIEGDRLPANAAAPCSPDGSHRGGIAMQGQTADIQYATVLTRVRPRYSARALSNKIQGSVRLEALIGADGMVMKTCIVRSLDPELDSEAAIAAFQWRFKPAVQNNRPVPIWATLEMAFSVQ